MIAVIFVAKYYKNFVHLAVIHLQLESGLEKFGFVVANKNIGKGWFKIWSHGNFVDLVMQDVIEAKLDRRSSDLHKFNKDLPWKRCRRVFWTVEGVSTDLNSLR